MKQPELLVELLEHLLQNSQGRALLQETVRFDPEAETSLLELTEAWDRAQSTDFLRTGAISLDGAAWRRVEKRLRGVETLKEGTKAGRYVVVEPLGEGGMGMVYLAYDPELDRRVAIKVLHTPASGSQSSIESRDRLMHEARMLAQLSHANVVAIHDVGTVQGQVFIAMEYVKGSDLAEWMDSKDHSWKAILEVFGQAGRGLEAAHQRELTHRDFKPQNVLIGEDGAIRVADFGLAESRHLPNSGESESISGTPAYMAPEQLLEGRYDHYSDQFSFCVGLWEALYGTRPYPGESIGEIILSFRDENLRELDSKSPVPPWIGQCLVKGLAIAPEDRWPSMGALLEALADDPSQRRKRLLWGALAAMAVVLSLAWGFSRPVPDALCTGLEQSLIEVWNPPRRDQLGDSFAAAGLAATGGVFDKVTMAVDAYAERWKEGRVDACEATHLRGEQSAELLDLRIGCLDRRLEELDAFLGVLEETEDSTILAGSAKSAHSLEPLDQCSQRELLLAPVHPPRDPLARQRIQAAEQVLARLKAERDTGQLEKVAQALPELLDEVTAIAFLPLQAEVSFLEADVQERLGHYDAAEASAFRTWGWAIEGASTQYVLRTLALLVFLDGNDRLNLAQAKRWGTLGMAQLAGLGEIPTLEAELYNALGAAHQSGGEPEESLRYNLKALDIRETQFGPDSLAVAKSRNNIGSVYYSLEEFEKALAHFQFTAKSLQSLLGDHADTSLAYNNIGSVLMEMEQYHEAFKTIEKARSMRLRVFSEPDIWVTLMLWNMGFAETPYAPESALRRLRQAADELPRFVPSDHPLHAYPNSGMGYALVELERYTEAIDAFERAISIRESSGTFTLLVSRDRFAMAKALWKIGRRDRALAEAQQALTDLNELEEGLKSSGSIQAWLENPE